MYLEYTIEAICDFYESKRHLKSIKMGTPEEQYKLYPLASVYNEHYLNERERLMYENHYHKKISNVFGDGPREIVNIAEDDLLTKPSTGYGYGSDSRSVASRDHPLSKNSLKVESSASSQNPKFN